jgi:hypothetical protein
MQSVIATIVLAMLSTGSLGQRTEPQWEATCSAGSGSFRITFRSPSGDVTNDDMVATILWPGEPSTTLKLAPGWFVPDVSVSSDVGNVCDRIVGQTVARDRVLLWVFRDDRPRWNRLSLILLDPRERRVVALRDDVGEIGNNMTVVRREQGVSVMLFRERRQDSTKGYEFAVPEWLNVVVKADRIDVKWRDGSPWKTTR